MRRPTNDLAEVADALHREALQSISERDTSRYADVVTAYVDLLLAFPRAWARYGTPYEQHVAEGPDPFQRGVFFQVTQKLYEELREAVHSGSREIVYEALGLPFRVASESVSLKAHALWVAMLTQLRFAYGLVVHRSDLDVQKFVSDLAPRYMFELGEYYAARTLADGEALLEHRREAATFLKGLFDEVNELLKSTIEAGDQDSLESTDDRWSRILEYWEPEYAQPREFEVDALAQEWGEGNARVKAARAAAGVNKELASLKKELIDMRTAYRFGLAFWSFRKGSEDAPKWRSAFKHFAAHFPSVAVAAEGANLALQLEWQGGLRLWSRWVLSEMPEGRAHAIGVDVDLMRTFLILSLLRADADRHSIALPTLPWFSSWQGQLSSLLEELAVDQRVITLIPSNQLESRVTFVRDAVVRASDEYKDQEAEVLRKAPLSAARVRTFSQAVEDSWRRAQLAVPLFRAAGAFKTSSDALQGEEGWFGLTQLMPKDLFVREPQAVGGDMLAGEIGRAMARGEMNKLLELMSGSEEWPTAGKPIEVELERALTAMGSERYDVFVLLTPVNARLEKALEIGKTGGWEPRPLPPLNISDDASHWYLGSLGEALVFEWPTVPADRIYFSDLRSFATWRQGVIRPEGRDIRVEIDPFDEEAALETVKNAEDLFRDRGLTSLQERANELRKHVLLRVRIRFDIQVQDPRATRYVTIPEELRRT